MLRAISRSSDLLKGLQLTIVVNDLERIGDYSKNIRELIEWFPYRIDFGPKEKSFNELHVKLKSMFRGTREALAENDIKIARKVMKTYERVSKLCDNTIKNTISNSTKGDMVHRRELAIVLMMRYLKRVAGHLKNVCSSVVNPFHKIGFREG